MRQSLSLNGLTWPRVASLVAAMGMAVSSVLTIQHFFATNFPTSIYEGSFCDINAFFNCDASAYSAIAELGGVPLGYLGLAVACLLGLGAVFPSAELERSNKTISLVNALGVVGLLVYSLAVLESLCLLCAGYYVFALLAYLLFWKCGIDGTAENWLRRWFRPSVKHLAAFAVMGLAGAYGFSLYTDAKTEAEGGGVSARVVEQYFGLPKVHRPSILSPYWSVKSTERFEDAPIQVIEYGDFLCPDCLYFTRQMERLKKEFAGKLNVVYQFFPLDTKCNHVVDKNLHPGACDMAYIAAHDPSRFAEIHDEVYSHFRSAKKPEWRMELAREYGVEAALADEATKRLVQGIIETGAEYEKTSDRYPHGVRSTPTLIINNRMVIGTFPYAHLRAIFRALVEKAGEHVPQKRKKFMEHWMPPAR